MTEPMAGFAERPRTLRKQKDLSRTELGQRAGLRYTHIGRVERGASRPGGDTLTRLAEALDVTGADLLDGAQDEATRARIAGRDLLRQFQEAGQLSDAGKHVVKTLLDAFLTKKAAASHPAMMEPYR